MGSDPKTEAGRRLRRRLRDPRPYADARDRGTWDDDIRAIEEEAARLVSPADREGQVDLPERIVVGKNGAYWRDYSDFYSMCPVSDDNDPVEPVAVYVQAKVDWKALYKARTAAYAQLEGRLGQREDAPLDAAPSREDLYRKVAESAERDVAAWPEWKREARR